MHTTHSRAAAAAIGLALGGLVLAGCGGGAAPTTAAPPSAAAPSAPAAAASSAVAASEGTVVEVGMNEFNLILPADVHGRHLHLQGPEPGPVPAHDLDHRARASTT